MTRALLAALVLCTLSSFAAGREIAPRPIVPSAHSERPAVALAAGRFLTVWSEDRRDFGPHIVGMLSDENGGHISPTTFVIVPHTRALWVELVPVGDSFALFWQEANQVNMADVDRDGRMTDRRGISLPAHIARDIAWNGDHFLFAFEHTPTVARDSEAWLLDRSGRAVRTGIDLHDYSHNFDIVVAGNDFIVITPSFFGLYAHRVNNDGVVTQTVLDRSVSSIGLSHMPLRTVSTTTEDGGLLVVWSRGEAGAFFLQSVAMSATGVVGPVHVLKQNPLGITPLHVARGSSGYVVPFTELIGQLRVDHLSVAKIDGTGALIEPAVGDGIRTGRADFAEFATASSETAIRITYARAINRTFVDTQIVLSRDGQLIRGPEAAAHERSRQAQPILVAGGGRFLAALMEGSTQTSVRTASLNAHGEPLANAIVATRIPVDAVLDLASNGTDYLAIYESDFALLAQRLDAGGNAIDPHPIFLDGAQFTQAAVTWAVDRWVVVWIGVSEQISFATVSLSGVATPAIELPLDRPRPANWRRFPISLALAADGARVLLAWAEVDGAYEPARHPSFAIRFRRDGRLIDESPVLLAGDGAHTVSAATSGGEFAVVTNTVNERWVQTIGTTGTLRTIATRTLPPALTDITWDGRDYVIASRYERDRPGYLVVRRLTRTLDDAGPARRAITLPSDEVARPSIAALTPGDSLIAIAEGDPLNGSTAVVYAERDMQSLDAVPNPRRRRAY